MIDRGEAKAEPASSGSVDVTLKEPMELERDEFTCDCTDEAWLSPGDTVRLDSLTITLPPDTKASVSDDKIMGRTLEYTVYDEATEELTPERWEEIKDILFDKEEDDMGKETTFSTKVADLLKSNTSTIESAIVGPDALEDLEAFEKLMEELCAPILKRSRFWAITGPVKLSAYDEKKKKWKMVSCLGGEHFEFKGMRVGNRDGLLLQWFTSDISGISDEILVETSVPKHGHMLAELGEDNVVGTEALRAILAAEVGSVDLLDKAEEIRQEAEKLKEAERAKKIEEAASHYGSGFGSWG